MAWRVVSVQTDAFDELAVIVAWPASGETAWTEGAPVVVVLPAALSPAAGWTRDFVPNLSASGGLVEVTVVPPGMGVAGHHTSGDFDYAGEASVTAVREAVLFAAGERTGVDGASLPMSSGVPVCGDEVVIAARSSGSMVGMRALARDAELLAPHVVGLVAYEPPSLPAMVGPDAGALWMDPHPETDHDDNGIPWDEGRNRSLDEAGCDEVDCPMELDTIRWTEEVSMDDVFGVSTTSAPPGVLYLDRDHSGKLDLVDGHPDVDGDGVIGEDEDAILPPLRDLVTRAGGSERHVFTPQVLAAAMDAGVLSLDDWPTHVEDPEATVAFWSTRHMLASVSEAAELADWRLGLAYTEVPHAVTLTHRANVRLVYEAAYERGLPVRYNAPEQVVSCLEPGLASADWPGGPDLDMPLLPPHMAAAAFPSGVDAREAMTLSTAAMFWDAYGPDHRCR